MANVGGQAALDYRNRRWRRRWQINHHAARGGFFVRHPVEGEVLEALEDGRLTIGEGTLLEPGCWLTLASNARIEIGSGCFLNRNTMLAAYEEIVIGDHVMFANGCFVGDADHRFDDPDTPVTSQGFTSRGPVRTARTAGSGSTAPSRAASPSATRCVIGANSVVTRDIPSAHRRRRAGQCDQGHRVPPLSPYNWARP